MKERPNEEEIRTRLRELTDESRRLRQELSAMITAHQSAARRFLDRETWTNRSPPPRAPARAKGTRVRKGKN